MDHRGAVALVIGLLCLWCFSEVSAEVQSELAAQDPVAKSNGLCATFVLNKGPAYGCDEYVVQTSDGFLLGVQRMYNGGISAAKKPVFLYHGILAGGESWMFNVQKDALPFILADAGYDVWIGNTRTTSFSGGHVTLARSDQGFWDWSVDQLAAIDLPSMLDLVSSKTTTPVQLVSYSQGTQATIAALSQGMLVPNVNKVVLVAPVAYVSSISSIMAVAAGASLMDQMMLLFHVYEFNPDIKSGQHMMDIICALPKVNCDDLLTAVTGDNCCVNSTRKPYYNQYPESTAMKNLAHLAQQFRTRSFAKYDYGFLDNLDKYHSLFPPAYDMSAIPEMPLLLIHGGTDGLADSADVNVFLGELKFTPQVTLLPDYGHMDLMVGTSVHVDVYDRILTFLATG